MKLYLIKSTILHKNFVYADNYNLKQKMFFTKDN